MTTKRIFDILFSCLVLLFVFPLLAVLIAIIVKVGSPGPIFFRQRRTGRKEKEFTCLKFRTMRVNIEADVKQAVKNDPRITCLGSFLRNSNLDELPQFINVLKGDMSVVGPRPHMLAHTEYYSQRIPEYNKRHEMKPGITGLAQVTGYRGETKELKDMEGRVQKDLWYIDNWSFSLDLKIIARTVLQLVKKDRKAY